MPRYIIYKILTFLRLYREFPKETYPNCLIGKVQLAMLATSVTLSPTLPNALNCAPIAQVVRRLRQQLAIQAIKKAQLFADVADYRVN